MLFATFFICGLSTNGLIQTHWITLCGDFGVAPWGPQACSLPSARSILSEPSCRAGFPIGTTIAGSSSGTMVCGGCRCFGCRSPTFRSTGCRYLQSSTASTGSPQCRPPCGSLQTGSAPRSANLMFGWIFAAHQLGAATAAYGAGATRDGFSTYLPALYVAGAFCLLAAALALTISRRRPILAPIGAGASEIRALPRLQKGPPAKLVTCPMHGKGAAAVAY